MDNQRDERDRCKNYGQLTKTGNFHPNGDMDKLYLPRSQGDRGLKTIAEYLKVEL